MSNNIKEKKMQKIFGRIKLYFTTGHSLILYIPWFITQTTIWYYLLIESVPSLKAAFPHYYIFFVAFIALYPLTTTLVGFWYVRKSELFPSELATVFRQSPYNTDLAKAISLIAQEKNLEAVKLLEKWTKRT